MKLFSHRGNITGKNPERENAPDYLLDAQQAGYGVELDVWRISNKWYSGHDEAQYALPYDFFMNMDPKTTLYHTKNPDALYGFRTLPTLHYFWHDKDVYTLSSWGVVICNISVQLLKDSIVMLPELGFSGQIQNCHGICSDHIEEYNYLS